MPEFSVVFYNRDFSGRLPVRDVKVDRYSWSMIGGPQQASFRMPANADKLEMDKLIRCPVEIWCAGEIVWWGFVSRVNIPYGEQRIGTGLDELYNYVTVSYGSGVTSAASNAVSVSEYGQKEIAIDDSNATQTQAEQKRDLYLQDHKDPVTEFEFSDSEDDVTIECYGWYSSLGWKYYIDTDIANTENTTQISNIVASAGQFLRGTVVEDEAGITSNENRDGNSTALTYVNQLLNAGTTNTRPLLAYVDKDRYLHVYEREAEPVSDAVDYVMREDGRLEKAAGGQIEPDYKCLVAVWGGVKGANKRPFFIESAEYDAGRDKTTYRPAGGFEQIRLAKFIAAAGRDGLDGTAGLSALPIFWTPEADPITFNFVEYSVDQIDQDDSTGFYVASTINQRNNPVTANDLGGYTSFKFHTPGLYYIMLSCQIVDKNYDYQLYVTFPHSSFTPNLQCMSVQDILSTDTSYVNFSGAFWVSDPTNGCELWGQSTGGSATTFDVNSSRLVFIKLG